MEQIKYANELYFWMERFALENGVFNNSHYADLMLGIAGEPNDDFLQGKVVADFGCGPRGSLAWTSAPRRRFGIDVLAPAYLEHFGPCMQTHGMEYLPCTEGRIPLPSASVDVLFTINALDHVSDLSSMCKEVLRILKPGGLLVGSFNLHEPACACEPQNLSERLLGDRLFRHLSLSSYRLGLKNAVSTYKDLKDNRLVARADPAKPHVLWATGLKKAA